MIPKKKNDDWKDNDPDKETWEKWKKDPNKWKWGGIYYNKEDNRLFVPKKIEWMGITINFANKKAKWACLLFLLFFSMVLFFILNKS
ncbi:DUF5808 domain-containing protein [Flavobacterium taihuense]|uniref:DUF5808 domain-containing protein n=1 Tax=Flavobacterium taihuense TaxID=2857508 RepID=A0ABS6XVK8_9FLAO|nr:DUF5808 domain-containing protein [Flavobacterium taihuense]MBW4360397.1 hypothetical protein [Flavobacterium taihuense]